MANEQEAGAIIVSLRAQIDGLEKGFAKAKETLRSFGKDTEQAAEQTEKSGQRMGSTFEEFDRKGARLASRAAMMTNRLLSLQLVMNTFGERIKGGNFSKGVQVASDSLVTFGAIVSVFPNKFGLIAGAIAATGVAIANLAGPTEAYKKQLEELDTVIKRVDKGAKDIFAARMRRQFSEDASDIVARASGQRVTDPRRVLEAKEGQIRLESANLEDLQMQLRELKKADLANAFLGKREELAANIKLAREGLAGLGEDLKKLKAAADLEDTAESWNEAMNALDTKGNALEAMFKKGLIDPAQRADEEIKLLEERVRSFFALPAQLQQRFKISGEVFQESLQSAVGDKENERIFRERMQHTEETDRQFQQAQDEAAAKRLGDNIQGFNERFTEPFSQAIGFAVADGIMSGAPAMETLANVGRNLFGNFLNDSIKNFQTGMAEAFKGIAGVGGEALAGAFTAIAGVVGGILMNRKGRSSESFSPIKSQIESSQAVRGIVAGPSNVAIAAVGENIQRAFEPSRQLLAAILDGIKSIDRKTGGGGAIGGGGFAGRVATT